MRDFTDFKKPAWQNGKGEFGCESAWGARGRKEAITIIVVSSLFYTSYFTGITILSYVLASQTQKYLINMRE